MVDRIVDNNDVITGNLEIKDSGELEGNEQGKQGDEETQKPTIPDKFKDKSPEEIAASYVELEKTLGRQAQELGKTRKLADQLLEKELNSDSKTTTPKQEEVEFDLDNPVESINKLVQNALNKELQPVKEQLTSTSASQAQQQLESKHPDWKSVTDSEDFLQWVNSSPVRTQLYQDANTNLNVDAAFELIDTFKALHPKEDKGDKDKEKQKRVDNMTTESGSGTAAQTSRKIFKRSEIINLRATNPKKYFEMAEELRTAYAEGRVR